MVYRALGVLFSDSGYSVAFSEFHENAGAWTFTLKANSSYLTGNSVSLIEKFIEENNLQYQVALITVHAESPSVLFNGASVAAATRLPVITDLTALDTALGGNGDFYNPAFKKLNITSENMNGLNKTICIAFMGILRWREEYNFLSSVTGASRSSIGGAVWLGQEA
jgi:anhydro-N-acetylmuramic acid kinase